MVEARGVGGVEERVEVERLEGVQVEEVGGGGGGGDGVWWRPQGQRQLWHPPQRVVHAHEGGTLPPQRLLPLPPLGTTVLEPYLGARDNGSDQPHYDLALHSTGNCDEKHMIITIKMQCTSKHFVSLSLRDMIPLTLWTLK